VGLASAVSEIMVATGRIRDFILDPAQTDQIQEAIAEGQYYGIQTFDQALVELIKEDRVSYEEALKVASRPQDFRLMVQALGLSNIR
jgi:twitching motility protein PilT